MIFERINAQEFIINFCVRYITLFMVVECICIYSIKDIGNDSNLLIVFYVQIMPDDFVMQLHRF